MSRTVVATVSLTLLLLTLIVPHRAAAQQWALSPFAARNGALAGAPTLYGAAITIYSGATNSPLGLRISGATGALAPAGSYGATSSAAARAPWGADADLLLDAGRIPAVGQLLRTVLGGVSPYIFSGVGVQVPERLDSGPRLGAPVWSYGLGASRMMIGPLGVESEARYRVPFARVDQAVAPAAVTRGWEYRAGLTLRFGRGRTAGRDTPRWPTMPRIPVSTTGRAPTSTPRASATAARVIDTADDYVGARYVYGGTTPDGFDCSGFVQYVFRKHGVQLPRTSRQQAEAGWRVEPTLAALAPGDLMFFKASSSRIDHMAMYVGDGRMIHSSSSAKGVRYDDLRTARGQWFLGKMVAARRVVADGASLVESLQWSELGADAAKLDLPDRAPPAPR